MTEKTETPGGEDAGDLRGTLIRRLAVAGVLVAILLGVLAFFDYLSTAPEEPEQQVFTQPVPVAPKKEVSQPVKPAENLPEPPAEAAQPAVEAQLPAVAEVRNDTEAAPEKRPLPSSTTSVAKVSPTAPQIAAQVRSPRAIPEGTASPVVAPDAPPTLPKPSARAPETRAAQPVPAPVVSRLFSGFLLQAGVFSSAQRAEELHAKLTLSGVPSTLETRVQVGPFRTRQEAEAAQAKLKELGIEAILVPPKGGRS
ncbi:SPOR domain-containing protein [Dechloromonas sp. A34]|uniref:SPOR domain-containing protein n=1 Tax=Dechloromonas sp. A34 TaxID=447588 RepID=UPI002249486A|nr:SPOR domain-containing protein [Dechloromonas sp. A34]